MAKRTEESDEKPGGWESRMLFSEDGIDVQYSFPTTIRRRPGTKWEDLDKRDMVARSTLHFQVNGRRWSQSPSKAAQQHEILVGNEDLLAEVIRYGRAQMILAGTNPNNAGAIRTTVDPLEGLDLGEA